MTVRGTTHRRFAAVRDAVAANLADGSDLGCALAVVRAGEIVVDLTAGHADAARTRPWEADTLVNIWSVTKGIVALEIAMAVERGLVRYDAPLADVWPGFASGGKQEITLDLVLSHRAGLNGLDRPMDIEGVYAWRPFVDALAAMAPLWPPASRCVYHALTFGHLAGEALARVDGRRPGRFLAEEIAGPLGLDIHIGLAAEEDGRSAEMTASDDAADWTAEVEKSGYGHAVRSPRIEPLTVNERAWRATEIPAGNGQATALALAKLYGLLAAGGGGLLSPGGIAAAARPRFEGLDASMLAATRFAAGFRLGGPDSLLGPNPRSFGHSGWGGAFAFADPDSRLGVAYVMNRMLGTADDSVRRHERLIDAVYGSL